MPLVHSSNIHSLDYDFPTRSLDVVFRNQLGYTYRYIDVSFLTYEQVLTSPSIGSAFDQLVKKADPPFRWRKFPSSQAIINSTVEEIGEAMVKNGIANWEMDENGRRRLVVQGDLAKQIWAQIIQTLR